jgi:hypothetical protein
MTVNIISVEGKSEISFEDTSEIQQIADLAETQELIKELAYAGQFEVRTSVIPGLTDPASIVWRTLEALRSKIFG